MKETSLFFWASLNLWKPSSLSLALSDDSKRSLNLAKGDDLRTLTEQSSLRDFLKGIFQIETFKKGVVN